MATGSRCCELPYWPTRRREAPWISRLRLRCRCCSRGGSIGGVCSWAAPSSRALSVMARGAYAQTAAPSESHVSASRAVARRRGRRARRLPRRRRGALGRSVVRRFHGARCAGGGERRAADTRGGCRASGAVRLQLRRHRAVAARRYAPAAVRQPRISDRRRCCSLAGSRRARLAPSARSFASARPIVAYMQAAVGLSVVELERDGRWGYVRGSRYNRRVTAHTAMEIAGPARGHALLESARRSCAARVRHARQLRGRHDAVAHLCHGRRKRR